MADIFHWIVTGVLLVLAIDGMMRRAGLRRVVLNFLNHPKVKAELDKAGWELDGDQLKEKKKVRIYRNYGG